MAMTDTDTNDDALYHLRLARTLRRCRNQTVRPPGVTREEVQAAFDAGLLKFVHCAASHYGLTDAGHELLSEH